MLPFGNLLYHSLIKGKKKERFDIILEPLQAILQLALLSATPIDTKINITNNILYIQIPTWRQSITRTYYNDSKNDLFILFSAIQRFSKFYNYLNQINNNETDLFSLLKLMADKGIDNLLQTYKQTDNPALLHTLQIYKSLLSNTAVRIDENLDNCYENESGNSSDNRDIDNIFVDIRNLYTDAELMIIFNTLLLIQRNPNNYLEYINGLNEILEPINKQIRQWIVENIVY